MEDQLYIENQYYKKQLDQQSGQILKIQHVSTRLNAELSSMKHGFSILNELQTETRDIRDRNDFFKTICEKLITGLSFHRVAIVVKNKRNNQFYITNFLGFNSLESSKVALKKVKLPQDFIDSNSKLLVNGDTESTKLIEYLRKSLFTNFFILVPIIVDNETTAFVFAGRITESKITSPKLDQSYISSLEAICGFIGAMLYQNEINKGLDNIVRKRTKELNESIQELLQVSISRKALSVLLIVAIIIFLGVDGFIDPIMQNFIHNFYIIIAIKALLTLFIKPLETLLERFFYSRSRKLKFKKITNSNQV